MARRDGIDHLRDGGVVIANDAGEHRVIGTQPREQVVAKLVFNPARAQALFGKLRMTPKLGEGLRKITQGRGTSRVPTSRPHSQSIVGILRQPKGATGDRVICNATATRRREPKW